MRILAVVGAVLLGALLIILGAFGARWLAPAGGAASPAVVGSAPGSEDAESFDARLDVQTLRELLAVIGPEQRAQILDSEDNFDRFVRQEILNQAVLAAAYANGADDNETIEVLMQRAGQRVLVEAYLNQVVQRNLDPDFPSDAQVREAYDKNPDAFRLPQRLHLWQIYIPLAADANEAVRKQTRQLADGIAADLRAGKATFEAMARKHSAHQTSRLSDGYMGLIKVDELLPAVAEAALALENGGISAPVATETGLHILKRGAVVESDMLEFEVVAGEIRERLRNEAVAKVRQAALEKIEAEYPVDGPTQDPDSLREALRAAAPMVETAP
ncbi:MAG: peptidylprolyl isomerase [Gammaproteobacteria bacterium]